MTAGTVIKLAFLSLAVGLVLSFFGVTPANFWKFMGDLALSAWETGAVFFAWAKLYILIGAAVVVPVYVARNLFRYLGKKPGDPASQDGQDGQDGQPGQSGQAREE